jgi:hypothetical protein
MGSRQAVEKDIERLGDPEVFFDILLGRAESGSGSEKDVAAVLRTGFEELRKAGIHRARLAERSAAAVVVATGDEVLLPVVA